MRARLVLFLALTLTACQVAPGRVAPPKPSVKPTTAPKPLVTPPPTLISDNGGVLVGNNAASLAGAVRAPAGLVTDNGAGIVSQNGASYGLLAAPAEVPVAGVAVTLLDAAGQPVAGADGQPLRATTDGQGRFAFPAAPEGRGLVAAAELPGGKGRLQALVAKDVADRKAITLDFVSTLTTGYILATYVRAQAEPLAVLEKLPAQVEAETRAATRAALDAGATAVPAALTPAAAVDAVAALRQAVPALDRQLEVVRELLLVAGLSDFGAGEVATQAALGDVHALAVAADGAALIACGKDNRIWRVGADGKLATLAGTGKPDTATPLEGLGQAAPLSWPRHLVVAGDRLLLLDAPAEGDAPRRPARRRATWLGPGGVLADVAGLRPATYAAFPHATDANLTWLLEADAGQPVLRRLALAGGTPDGFALRYAADAGALLKGLAWGLDGAERLYVATRADDVVTIARAAAGGSLAPVAQEGQDGVLALALAPDGRIAALVAKDPAAPGGARSLVRLDPDGTRTPLLDAVPADFELASLAPVAFALDGGLLAVRRGNQVVGVRAGQVAPVAGRAERLAANATAVALYSPAGLVAGADGALWLADKFAHRVYKREPDGTITVVAGVGGGDAIGVGKSLGDGGPAAAASLDRPRALRRDAAGNLYVLEAGLRVRKIDVAGGISTIWRVASGWSTRDMALAPDGTAYYALRSTKSEDCQVIAVAPGGAETAVLPPAPVSGTVLGTDAAGVLHLLTADGAARRLQRWTPAGGLVDLADDPAFELAMPNDANGLAVDARGRVIVTLQARDRIVLWDPATKAVTRLAGEGGRHFAGQGTDNSLNVPRYPVVAPNGDLYFSDTRSKQVKRIPAGEY